MSQSTARRVSKLPMQTNDVSITDKLQERQAKRAAKAAERKQKSDTLREEGNVLFRDGDYMEAADCYQQAIQVHGDATKPVLLTNLAAAYLKLDMYGEAYAAAGRALEADPKSIKARFRRGVARRHLEMMTAAAIDFRAVLRLDPGNKEAKRELELVEEVLPEDDLFEEDMCSYSDNEAPAPEEEGYVTDSMSESSDCEHTGNGVPCKFYNHAGCAKGKHCRFSHTPDSQSERDELGRNVCIYYLMGVCKFGAKKCNYLHSKEYLPQKGWWTTPEGVHQGKILYKFRKMVDNALGLSGPGRSKPTQRYPKLRPKVKPTSKKSSTAKKKGIHPPVIYGRGMPELSDSDEEEYNEYGFTNSDMQELLAQGVKPWDDDAHDVLDVLRGL